MLIEVSLNSHRLCGHLPGENIYLLPDVCLSKNVKIAWQFDETSEIIYLLISLNYTCLFLCMKRNLFPFTIYGFFCLRGKYTFDNVFLPPFYSLKQRYIYEPYFFLFKSALIFSLLALIPSYG
jgi:hypothetical protein